MRWLVTIAMIGAPVLMAQWTRVVQSSKGLVPMPEPPRKFSYFQGDPCHRDDEHLVRRLLDCYHKPNVAMSEIRIVGRLTGVTVYEAFYSLPSEGAPHMRSVFVKAAGGRYFEIFLQAGTPYWRFDPVKVFFADGAAILEERYQDRHFFGTTFVLTATGARHLDFAPGLAKADAALPPGRMILDARVDYGAMTLYYSTAARSGDVTIPEICCDGEIAVPFRIVDGRLVPGEGQFTAKRQ